MAIEAFYRIIAFGLLASLTTAQEVFKTFNIFSASDCGVNASELSGSLTVFPPKQNDSNSFITDCSDTYIGWPDWPTSNGQYQIWVDTTPIDDKCQLIFFTGPPQDDEIDTFECFQYYRALNGNSDCPGLEVSEHFGYSYCCNDACSNRLGKKKKREKSATPINPPDVGLTDTAIKTMYGPQEMTSSQLNCPEDSMFGCPINGEISMGQTIGNSTSLGITTGFTAEFAGIGASVGIDTTNSSEWSSSTTFSTSYSLSIGAGDNAYLTFMPKYKCTKGKFEGSGCNSALLIGENTWCVPALIQGNATDTGPIPDGIWNAVEVN